MATLPGYDAWWTRQPDEGPGEDLRWYARLYSPHISIGCEPVIGPFDTKREAEIEGGHWELERQREDPEYSTDYGIEVFDRNRNEGCTCRGTLRSRRNCEIHGIDPDTAYDARGE